MLVYNEMGGGENECAAQLAPHTKFVVIETIHLHSGKSNKASQKQYG